MVRWLTVAMVWGCDDPTVGAGCPPLHERRGGECQLQEAAAVARTFRDALELVNDEPFLQVVAAGTPLLRNVWISSLPLGDGRTTVDLYRTIDPSEPTEIDGDFPIGTVLLHEAVDGSEGNTMQVHLGPEYDDGNGRHWWFGKYYEDGLPDDEPCTPCTACHSNELRPGSDGLWGVPRDVS
jgi:hypothetical protein